MKKSHNRSHPVRLLTDHLAIGGVLERADLDEIQWPDAVDRREVALDITAAAKLIATERAAGNRGIAKQIARESAAKIIARYGDCAPDRHDDDPTDPRGLAALIQRR